MKPYYSDDAVTIYHGDCREILPTLSPVDLVVTSPPYNRGSRIDGNWQGQTTASCKGSRFRAGYTVTDDAMPWADYRAWLKAVLGDVFAAVATGGAMWVNHKPRVVNGLLWMPTEALADLPLRQLVIWDTGPGINFTPGAFVPAHEWLMLVAHHEWRLAQPAAASVGDVWRIQPESSSDHPAPFPEGLVSRILAASPPGTVLDPFMGTGTTLRVAKDLGRKAIGIEISEAYCEIAAKRMGQEVLDFGATP